MSPFEKAERKPISDIEILRAFAVLSVVFSHKSALLAEEIPHKLDQFFQFWGGVDIFFVISGFVISRGLIAARLRSGGGMAAGREIVAFWIRRVWRIVPTAWFWAALIMGLSLISDAWGYVPTNTQTIVAILSNLENLHQYYCHNGIGLCGGFPLSLYWSLSLEEQFYFIIPVALLFLPMKRLAFGIGILILAQLFLLRPPWSFWWAVRSDGLLLGTAIALTQAFSPVHALFEPVFLAPLRFGRVVFTALLLIVITGMAAQHIVPFGTGVMALCSALLVWAASFNKDYLLPPGVLKHVLVWIGARSYAIYLIHVPAFYFTQSIWRQLMPAGTAFDTRFAIHFTVTAALLIAVLAEANYRIIEQPLRRRGAGFAKRFLATRRDPAGTVPVPAESHG